MYKFRHYFSIFLKIADEISYFILFFIAICTILNLNLFAFDVTQYDDETGMVYQCVHNLFLIIALLMLLFLLKRKYPRVLYIELVLWGVLFFWAPYLLHQIPSVAQAYTDIF